MFLSLETRFFKLMTFSYKQSKIHYSAEGEGENLILVHGFLENKNMWKNLILEFSKTHRVFTIDLPGHGDTNAIGYIHTMKMYAEIIQNLMAVENINKASMIGHSMGGYAALAFAELFPEKLKKLILLNSTSAPDTEMRQQDRNRAIKMIQKFPEAFVNMAVKNLFLPKNQKRFETEINLAISEAKKCSQQGIINTLKGLRDRKDRSSVLKEINEKTLIILGEDDQVIDIEKTNEIAESNQIEVKILFGGHMSHIEHPDVLKSLCLDFL